MSGAMNLTKTKLTFAIFQGSGVLPPEIAQALVKFNLWESCNLTLALSSEERLAIWDQTQNGGRLTVIFDKMPSQSG